MEGKDNIKELFSQKLGNYEAKVNPELWGKISAQVAAGASTTVATGLSLFAKVAIGIGVSAAAITTVVLLSTSNKEIISEKPVNEVKQEMTESNSSESTDNKVAEIQSETTTESTSNISDDVRNTANLLTPNRSSNSSSQSSTPLTTASATASQTPEFPKVDKIPMKPVVTVTSGTTEPQIVKGITFSEMTSYGAIPANVPDEIAEVNTPKSEPVKRFVNIFTPNGDGQNDYFKLESEGLTDFSVVVFDPKGDIVFQSNDPNFRWDGRDIRSGEMVESGAYMYMVSAYDSEGNPYPIYERLTINR